MLKVTRISFPGLFPWSFDVNSVAFTLFGHEFPWYALILTSGIVICFFYIIWRGRRVGITSDNVIDVGLVTVICGILGARIYYVLCEWDHYRANPSEIIKIWHGGIAIYGALIGGGLAVLLMCRIKKLPFLLFADCTCPSLLLAQALGRWGNFFNAEAYGAETDIFCRMGLQTVYASGAVSPVIYVHPTFLYESIWNIIGFFLANWLFKHRKYDGFLFHFVFAWYGFGRMFIELLRSDSLYICSYHAWFTKISVLVGFAFFVSCTAMMITSFVRLHRGQSLKLTPMQEMPKKTENKNV